MRVVAAVVVIAAALCGCGRTDRPTAVSRTSEAPPCRSGDLARTAVSPARFADGWVQLGLQPCEPTVGAVSKAAVLRIDGASTALAFQQGRPGSPTLGVLAAIGGPPASDAVFPVRWSRPPTARTLVLAPWSGSGPAPSIGTARVVSSAEP